jgi:hypothetical protein
MSFRRKGWDFVVMAQPFGAKGNVISGQAFGLLPLRDSTGISPDFP